jgi:hypothetical protein
LCLAAAVVVTRVAAAQPAPSAQANPAGVELLYDAFAGCPEREAFAKNLEARRRGDARTPGAVQLHVRLLRLEAQGDGAERVEGSIVVSGANGGSARRIVAATCDEAADALALIAALALQGIEVEELPAADSDRPPARPRAHSSE